MAQRPTLHVVLVTALQTIYDGESEMVNAPGSEGRLGILPRHAPLLTTLDLGELRIREHGVDESFFVAGGFLEVNDNVVTILADDAERAGDIDEERAEAARQSAHATLSRSDVPSEVETAAQGELERAIGRLRVAEVYRARQGHPHRPRRPGPQPTDVADAD